MTQSDFGTIDPNTKSGTQLATDLNGFRNAVNSNHGGAARPAYAQAGMTWLKNVSATANELYLFDGTDDILLCTFDYTNNRIFLPGGYLFTTAGVLANNANNAVINPLSAPPDGMSYEKAQNRLVLAAAGVSLSLVRHASDGSVQAFYRNAAQVGGINVTTTATAYVTSSDYRLKYDIEPLVTFTVADEEFDGVPDIVKRILKWRPVTFAFHQDDVTGRRHWGFIAHELQEHAPYAVTGKKDGMRDWTEIEEIPEADGTTTRRERHRREPEYQGVDHSKLVPELVAAVQALTDMLLETRLELRKMKESQAHE